MKKALALILALVMTTVMFVSCADKTHGGDQTKEPGTAAPGKETTPQSSEEEKTKKPKPEPTSAPDPTTEKPEVPVPTIPEGLMVLYEDFDSYANTTGSKEVAQLLGWQIRNKVMEGEEFGALTDNTTQYSIENGALKLLNYDGGKIDGKDSYLLIAENYFMKPAASANYTIQYDVKYTASSATDRYIALISNYDGYDSYNSFHLRARGTGNNQVRIVGSWYTYDVPGEFYAAGDDSDAKGTSIVNKLYGTKYDSSTSALQDKSLTIRYQADREKGPTIWIRDNDLPNAEFVCVSKPDAGGNGAFFWQEGTGAYALAIKTGGKMDGYVDNIAVWTGLGDQPLDVSTAAYESAIAGYLDEVKKAQ